MAGLFHLKFKSSTFLSGKTVIEKGAKLPTEVLSPTEIFWLTPSLPIEAFSFADAEQTFGGVSLSQIWNVTNVNLLAPTFSYNFNYFKTFGTPAPTLTKMEFSVEFLVACCGVILFRTILPIKVPEGKYEVGGVSFSKEEELDIVIEPFRTSSVFQELQFAVCFKGVRGITANGEAYVLEVKLSNAVLEVDYETIDRPKRRSPIILPVGYQ